ncbi:hypothetical protein RvY_18034 [Ramazzottius varieornatus]|uniref:Glucuronosyltransferase n=1 Tax=Ramazzottius varieornatus TaxID=947166 RepID=A0A1D1W4B0_RAMVA|nr:hypothetical protein RvY_18034 [Ramazzottius varieornatus]
MAQQSSLTKRSRKSILIIPFPAISPVIPHLKLAKKLAQHHSVTFALSETALTENKFKEIFALEPGIDITFFSIKDGHIHGKHDTFNDFNHILGMSNQGAIDTIDSTASIDAVITDTFLAGSVVRSSVKGIPHYIFDTACADILPLFFQLTDETPVIPDQDDPNGFCR